MKAIVYNKYGNQDVLQPDEIPEPILKDNEILIRIHAVSVNSWEWDLLRGKPFIARQGGFFRPKFPVLGADVAGEVTAIGKKISSFKTGDRVYGDLSGYGWGGYAEYTTAREQDLRLIPDGMSFEDASTLPQGGCMAYQGIIRMGRVQPGMRICINGAGGCVGPFAIQIAKEAGAEVTAVDAGEKLEMLQSIGADHCIDYLKSDFVTMDKQYDLILDNIAARGIREYKQVLLPGGKCIIIGGQLRKIFLDLLFGWMVPPFSKKIRLLGHRANLGLESLEKLYASGKLKPYIGHTFPLEETSRAFQLLGEGRTMGKAVITIG